MKDIQENASQESFQKILELHGASGLKHCKKVLRSYILFHAVLVSVLLVEVLGITISYVLDKGMSFFALELFAILLTFFTYLVLAFYFQAKKPEQLKQLKEWFLSMCKKSMPDEMSQVDYHLFLAQALFTFSSYFQIRELPVYLKRCPLISLKRLLKKCSYLWHWKDFQKMKEFLLYDCIHQHLSLLKYEPTNLEVHASLGNSYLTLGALYKSMHESFAPEDLEEVYAKKFKQSIQKAIEEYKIILESSINNPWVLAQLATCYHELGQFEKEIEAFEKLLEISESDPEIMFKLAYLYFQQEKNAKGFYLYKLLKESHPTDADALFEYYISQAQREVTL